MHHLYHKLERAYSNLLDKVHLRFSKQLLKINQLPLKKKAQLLKLKPVITVSRDPGSGGKLVARRAAKKLGFDFYDKRLLEELSKTLGKSSDVIEDIDEHTRSVADDFVHSIINPDYVSDVSYIKKLVKLMYKIGKKGNAIILGRGGNSIIPMKHGLHVRITAPEKFRIQNAVKYEKLSPKHARERVRKITKRRADFVEQYFNQDIDSPDMYDLIINTKEVSLDDAVDMVVKAYKKKFPKN